jgi:hypothetical protein
LHHPLREDDTSSSKYNKVNGFLTAAKFEAESQDMGVTYALVCKVEKDKELADSLEEINRFPAAVQVTPKTEQLRIKLEKEQDKLATIQSKLKEEQNKLLITVMYLNVALDWNFIFLHKQQRWCGRTSS